MTTKTEAQVGEVPSIRVADQLSANAGQRCQVCNAQIQKGDVVLSFRTKALIADSVEIQPLKVIHKYCITGMLDAEEHLVDEYDKIKQRVAEKGTMFDD